jgi:hypothetical protein
VQLRWRGKVFFCIPNVPSQVNVRERANTAIASVVKGSISTKQLEDEFTRILFGAWRWIARKYSEQIHSKVSYCSVD